MWADRPVAEEMATIPYDGYEDLWTFMARVEKLNEQLEACRE